MALGEQIWIYIRWNTSKKSTGDIDIQIEYDDVTYFRMSGMQYAPPTACKTYMVNEALARTVESVTDGEMTVYTEYFGRTDAEPYVSITDGCGSLECVTNGLMIRGAVLTTGQLPKMTISFNELFKGLSAIHSIGYGMEDDTFTPGKKLIRIEPLEYFYSNNVIFTCYAVNEFTLEYDSTNVFSSIKFGYSKYEGESINGLDEFLTSREYRASISNSKNTLDFTCDFIASGYAIEITRGKKNTSADWRLDNDTFIICLERLLSEFIVEQGNITLDSNIIDSATIYNYRISPWRNALRWFNVLFGQFNSNSATAEYKFTNGTGNYYAEGVQTGGCTDERTWAANSESGDINYFSFASYTGNEPLWTAERVLFSYPISVTEYNLIVANRYDKIGYSFANGVTLYGWIDSIKYKAVGGIADFVLKVAR